MCRGPRQQPEAETDIKSRQNHQGQQGGDDQTAEHHDRQWREQLDRSLSVTLERLPFPNVSRMIWSLVMGLLGLLGPASLAAVAPRISAGAVPLLQADGNRSSTAVSEPAAPKLTERQVQELGQRLVARFFERLSQTGLPTGRLGLAQGADSEAVAAVRKILDPAFIVQRADGRHETHDSYQPVDIDEFTLRGLHVTRPSADLLVVRYEVQAVDSLIPATGIIGSGQFSPRLSAFRWDPEQRDWLLISHANFNPPMEQICNPPQQSDRNAADPAPPSDAANARLADRLMQRWYGDLHRTGIDVAGPGTMLLPKAQLVYGDGFGRDGDSGYRKVKVGKTAIRNLSATRNGNILIARFDALNQLSISGQSFSDRWQPRLVTLVEDPLGSWNIASFAIFTFPQKPPADRPCRKTSLRHGDGADAVG